MKVQVDLSEDEDGSATDAPADELRQFTVYVQVFRCALPLWTLINQPASL